MSKRSKLFQRLRNNPVDATFSDIQNLLLDEEFVLDRVSGSHHIFRRGNATFVIPVHKNRVKSVYVRRVIEIIEEIKE